MNGCSTERVRRFRERQEQAGRKRIALYLDRETQRKLDQLAGEQAQAPYLETLVKAAIKREWAALESLRTDSHLMPNEPTRQSVGDRLAQFPGRRRSFIEKEQARNARVACNGATQQHR